MPISRCGRWRDFVSFLWRRADGRLAGAVVSLRQQRRLHQVVSEIVDWPSEELIDKLVFEAEVGCSDDGRLADPFRGVRDAAARFLQPGCDSRECWRSLQDALSRFDGVLSVSAPAASAANIKNGRQKPEKDSGQA
jgi:hypothetical protein